VKKKLESKVFCTLYDGDKNSGWITRRYGQFFEDGMWLSCPDDMSEEAYDCIMQCFAAG
jgi:hypothetical protein